LLAIARAAQAKNAPVLVEVGHDEVAIIGLRNMRSLVDNYRAEFGIEMYINLDHSPSIDAAKAGIDRCFFQSAAQIGVSKININSDLRYAYRTTLEAQLAAHPDQYAVVKLIDPVVAAVQDVVEQHIDLFGSTDKAQP
jgi:fructose/tagatose bisphosphate aldolase